MRMKLPLSRNAASRENDDQVFFEVLFPEGRLERQRATSVCTMVTAGAGTSVIDLLAAASQTEGVVTFRHLYVPLPHHLSLWYLACSNRMAQIKLFTTFL
jgi:DNA-binding transcriptional LysR family regulator